MQFFRESGTWHRPEGAVRVEVMAKGGDAGSSVGPDGKIIPGQEGEVVITMLTAEEAGESAPIEIGKGGAGGGHAPGGTDGYMVVVTYFD